MTGMMKSKTLSVSIAVSPGKVYKFVSNPENLSVWAASFAKSVRCEDWKWIVETDNGFVTVRFMMKNTFGILDHVVTLPSGEKIYNSMRVVQNGKGSEVLFMLFKTDFISDEQFERDAELVELDLQSLKHILENKKSIDRLQ
jgi:hypothetical protein